MTIKKLNDGTIYVKATHHNDKVLKGTWEVTYKIDGVRAIRAVDGSVSSRNSKPLYNCDNLQFTDAEIFRKDWETSVSLVRTQSYKLVTQADVYQLKDGELDARLIPGRYLDDSTEEERNAEMERAVGLGYEGIVLRQKNRAGNWIWVKVVPWKTIDVRITGYEMSDKRKGFIKNFQTDWGKIPATGFKIEQLEFIASQGAEKFLGMIAEMNFREWTKNRKMRFPAFVRWRFDKDEESLT